MPGLRVRVEILALVAGSAEDAVIVRGPPVGRRHSYAPPARRSHSGRRAPQCSAHQNQESRQRPDRRATHVRLPPCPQERSTGGTPPGRPRRRISRPRSYRKHALIFPHVVGATGHSHGFGSHATSAWYWPPCAAQPTSPSPRTFRRRSSRRPWPAPCMRSDHRSSRVPSAFPPDASHCAGGTKVQLPFG